MELTDKKNTLSMKAYDEYKDYVVKLLNGEKGDVLNASYKTTIFFDVMKIIEKNNFSEEKIDMLLSLPFPLEQLYRLWLDSKHSRLDDLSRLIDESVMVSEIIDIRD